MDAYSSKGADACTAVELISSEVDLPFSVRSKPLSLYINEDFKETSNSPKAPALPADSRVAQNPSDEIGPPCGFFAANA